ncbi:gfo/Idh/MocA family oxidoreductase [Sesbania bispinosa]|nr:gfo/Idh/MocA family oxidoreductase [Sesbania bispinosa]
MGQQPNIDIHTLLDNATKARVHIADRVTTKIDSRLHGVGSGGMVKFSKAKSDPPNDEVRDKTMGLNKGVEPNVKEKAVPQHPFNIGTNMNVEVLGPNHLRLIDDADPPDDDSTPIDSARKEVDAQGHASLAVSVGAATHNDVEGKKLARVQELDVDKNNHAPDMEMG